MEIGIGEFRPEHRRLYDEIGFTWCKFSCDLGDALPDSYRTRLDQMRECGLRPVLDLRTDPQWMASEARMVAAELMDAGRWHSITDDMSLDEQRQAALENEMAAHGPIVDRWGDWCAQAVGQLQDWCMDWEVWGESHCPHVAGGVFGAEGRVYSLYLRAAEAGIKSAQPAARVWTGGNGMNSRGLDGSFLTGLLEDGCGDRFDVANWHPYLVHIDPTVDPDAELARCREVYQQARAELRGDGLNQAFAATEWGFPSSPAAPEHFERFLRSNVVVDGVIELTATEAARWMEASLTLLEEVGFEVVCQTMLQDRRGADGRGGYWGDKVGLYTHWMESKPCLEVVQEWAWRGRQGRPAFATEGV